MAMMDLINRVYKTLPEGARAQMLLCDAVFLLYTFSEHLAEEDPMGLVRGKEIVAAAYQGGYAVGPLISTPWSFSKVWRQKALTCTHGL
jgi:hypothetical protein